MYIHIFALIMTIEEEIKVKSFKTVYNKLIVNLLYTGGWLNSQHNDLLKPYGLSMQQYNVLRILRGSHPDPASVNTIIDRMLDKNSNASRLVEKLRQKEYIIRTACSNDRRQVDVTITKKGLGLLSQIDDKMDGFESQFKSITKKEATELSTLLDKLRN